jgi:hypothetical protein
MATYWRGNLSTRDRYNAACRRPRRHSHGIAQAQPSSSPAADTFSTLELYTLAPRRDKDVLLYAQNFKGHCSVGRLGVLHMSVESVFIQKLEGDLR